MPINFIPFHRPDLSAKFVIPTRVMQLGADQYVVHRLADVDTTVTVTRNSAYVCVSDTTALSQDDVEQLVKDALGLVS